MSSLQGQDQWVLARISRGFFLDTGAGEADYSSNTVELERAGWTGICVEANPVFVDDLRRRRRCQVVHAVLAPTDGPKQFAALRNPWRSGLWDFLADDSKAAAHSCEAVAAKTLGQVLAECQAPTVIDYWSLDTEGSEWALLQSFPWDARTVRLLTVEHNHRQPNKELVRSFMSARGFRRKSAGHEDWFYKP